MKVNPFLSALSLTGRAFLFMYGMPHTQRRVGAETFGIAP